ncbi:hypothetical protein CK203_040270 [Vitis vinifera]|uniref:Uncharacterized protein n=1 Tax=Vitis vinifera TaxID=29760 RepID=A0A438HXF7_VITVI|nr:hypothetical protein CK203_040270 [Vitis vinifera]
MMMTIFRPYFCSFWLSIECCMVYLFDQRGLDAEVEYILGPCLKAEDWELMFSFPVVHVNPVGVSDKLSDASFSDDLGLDGVVICECINRLEDDKGFIPEMEVEMDLASEVSKSPVPHMKIKALLWRNLGNVLIDLY